MVPFRDIVRSALRRFLPGWIAALIAFPLIFAPHTFLELGRGQFALLTAYTTATLLGHVASLLVLRPRLRADAQIVGRKSFVAGACAVGAMLIVSMVPHGLMNVAVAASKYAAVGFGTTFVLYLPWVQSRAAAIEDREAARKMSELPFPRVDAVPLRYRESRVDK